MGRIRRGLLAAMAAAALAGCSGSGGGGGGGDQAAAVPDPAPSSSSSSSSSTTTAGREATRPQGPYAVGVRTEVFVDPSRPTTAFNTNPGAPNRTFETRIWYPARGPAAEGAEPVEGAEPLGGEGPFPVIAFSHGWSANNGVYQHLLRAWAGAGYVTFAPTFPSSSSSGGMNAADFRNQPADISFVLDRILELAAAEPDGLGRVVDPEQIGAAGHSLGGLTTAGLTGNACCADDRVDAAIPMAPALFFEWGRPYDWPEDTPTMVVHGDADELVHYEQGQRNFEMAQPPKFLVTLEGGRHTTGFVGPTTDPYSRVVVDTGIAFFDQYLKGIDDGVARIEDVVEESGVARLDEVLEPAD